jgi:small GTP-binding protein
MVGAAGVGKTSLVRRYVENAFSRDSIATMGVKVTKKVVKTDAFEATLMLWDMAGDNEFPFFKDVVKADRFQDQQTTHLHAYILVADLSRLATLQETIVRQQRIARGLSRQVPFILALNKSDLIQKEFDEAEARRQVGDWQIACTSAKTGDGVLDMFDTIAAAVFNQKDRTG